MAINIRKIDAVMLEGEPYNDWGERYDKFIRINMGGGVTWYTLDNIYRMVTHILPDQDKLEKLYKESNGFLEQLELF